ncbi:hypothetical protein EDC04DRAFT_2892144 [Pisolithus marmoratus]|nr:hypothetical protein EDC04DRAFT_2892144 [Pisolithus marmoratus]
MDVEDELTSPQNDRLALHVFTLHEDYDKVEAFIERRTCIPYIKDQLHAVWCVAIPTCRARLFEEDAKRFLQISKKILGNTPTIVVFTKSDQLASHIGKRDSAAEQRYLQEYCKKPIQDLTGDWDISYVATLPAKPTYEQGFKELMDLTQRRVYESFTPPGHTVSAVPLALADAQRMLPTSKAQLSIDVAKQRYWKALYAGANLPGFADCLGVIHADIVSVWNFYDPLQYLNSEDFRCLMINMAERVDAPARLPVPPSRSGTLDGGTPIPLLAPVLLPLIAGLLVSKWAYETYGRLRDVPRKFMAYIVDLTHVLEILFLLTAGIRAKRLTRTAIQLACKAYYGSEWMTHAHTDIMRFEYRSMDRDAVLEKITSMISSDDREVRASSALERIPSVDVDLEKDEEWADQGVSQ